MQMKKTLLGGVAAALPTVMLMFPAFAHATSQDDQFLAAVHSQGIPGQPDALIGFAHAACDTVGTPGYIGPAYSLMAQGVAAPQTYSVMLDAIRVYCPEKSSLVPQLPFLPRPS
jgi:hypothetical protein